MNSRSETNKCVKTHLECGERALARLKFLDREFIHGRDGEGIVKKIPRTQIDSFFDEMPAKKFCNVFAF